MELTRASLRMCMVRMLASGALRAHGLNVIPSFATHSLAVWPWTSACVSLCLNFLICKIQIMIVPISYLVNIHEVLGPADTCSAVLITVTIASGGGQLLFPLMCLMTAALPAESFLVSMSRGSCGPASTPHSTYTLNNQLAKTWGHFLTNSKSPAELNASQGNKKSSL